MLGHYALSRIAISSLDPAESITVYDPLVLVAEPADRAQIYLVEMTAWDAPANAVRNFYLATEALVSLPSDDPPNQYYDGLLIQPLRSQQSVVSGAEPVGQGGAVTGSIEILNVDGALSQGLRALPVNGRDLTIYSVARGRALNEAIPIFKGIADAPQHDESEIQISFRSRSQLLTNPVQTSQFAGSGGVEGGSDLTGKNKPLALGYSFGVSPVYLGLISGYPSYCVSGGWALPIQDIPQCFDMGIALTKVGGTPSAGEYAIDAAAGILTLGAPPAGTVTCNVEGFVRSGTYLTRTADIIAAILELAVGIDSADIDSSDLSTMNSDQPADVGFWVGPDPVTAESEINAYLAGITAYGGFDRLGIWRMGVLKAPGGTLRAVFDESSSLTAARILQPSVLNPPAWRQIVTYQWNHTVTTNIASGASDAQRSFMAAQTREAKAENAAILTAYPSSVPFRLVGRYRQQSDAQAEAERRLVLYDGRYGLYRIRTQSFIPELNIGQACRADLPRSGLNSKIGTILGIDLDIASAASDIVVWA